VKNYWPILCAVFLLCEAANAQHKSPSPVAPQPVPTITGDEEDVIYDIILRLRANGWIVRKGAERFSFAHRLKHKPEDRRSYRLTLSSKPHVFYHFVVIHKSRAVYYIRQGSRKKAIIDEPVDLTRALVEIPVDTRSRNRPARPQVIPTPIYGMGGYGGYGYGMGARFGTFHPGGFF